MSGRRIELTATQLTASVLAAMTGAIIASYLGVAGTIIGVAVVSFASTAGTAVYRHYLGRTQERLRGAASEARLAAARKRAGPPGANAPGTDNRRHLEATRQRQSGAAPRGPLGAPGPDSQDTEVLSARYLASLRLSGGDPREASAVPGRSDDPGGPGGPGRQPTAGGQRWWRRWYLPVALTLAVFLLTMAAITVIEATTGKPLDSLIWHRPGSGTTVGNAITGHSHGPGRPAPAPAPATPARPSSPAPSPSTTPSPSRSPSPSPSPSPTPASPSPSPSPSPSVTPSPSVSPPVPSPPGAGSP